MPFDSESGKVGTDFVFSVDLLREDWSCFFGKVEVDRSGGGRIIVDDDGCDESLDRLNTFP